MVGVEHGKRRERWLGAVFGRWIQDIQLAHEHRERPQVRDDVMNDQEQDVIVSRARKQREPQQWPLLQIKRAVSFGKEARVQVSIAPG
jgi:hypothetical protein